MEQPDVNAVAEPSAAAPVAEGFNASDQYTWSPEQREHWNKTGNPPEQPAKQDSAPASSPEKKVEPENAAEAGAAPKQEKKERKPGEKLNAEERISQLTSQVKRLEEEARERSRTPDPKPASEAETQASPATYADWRKQFKPSEWLEKWTVDNPQGTYDDANASMADHLYDVRRAYESAEVRQREMAQQAQETMRKMKEKHGDAEDRIKQSINELFAKAPEFIQAFVDDSDVAVDLLYALSEPGALQKVLDTARTSPGKALRILRDMELAADKEVSKPTVSDSKPPELKPRAPKPPAEVGGRGAPPEDALVSAARANDFRSFEAEQNRRMTASS